MKRYLIGGLIALVGVLFIALTFSQNLFRVGTDFEEMITDFRPALTDDSIATYTADVQGLGTLAGEFGENMLPAISAATGMDQEAFGAMMGEQFPNVAQGLQALPEISETFAGLIGTLAGQQDNFASADAIPTGSFVAQTVPWGFFALGLIALALGAAVIWWKERLGALIAMILGALIVIGSFALSLPGKSADADDLNAALKPVYTEETVTGAQGALAVVGAMGEEMQSTMLPGVAQMLQMEPDQFNQYLGSEFPVIAQALQGMPEQMERFEALVTVFDTNLENYETLKPVAFTPIIWTFIAGGFALIVVGAYGYFFARRED